MKYIKFLFSGSFMGILLVIFAISIGYATFIENDFDATTAKMLVYNARWFEVLMLLMVVNFAGMIFTRQLYRKSKLNILFIHIALIIIILGAAITRYIGFEGQMHIRQDQTTNQYISTDTYMNVYFEDGSDKMNISKRIWLSPVQTKLFDEDISFKNNSYEISMDHYLPNAIEALVPNQDGGAILSLVAASAMGREDFMLKYGESKIVNGIGISFGVAASPGNVQFVMKNGELMIKMPNQNENGGIEESPDGGWQLVTLGTMRVFPLPNMNLMVKDFAEKAIFAYIPAQNENQEGIRVAKVTIKKENQSSELYLKWGQWEQVNLDGVTTSMKFGNQNWVLPFSLRLNEFVLDRYPGSMSPSSFASEITLIDTENNVEKPYRIFMNNILEYKGYRFYQSSYDTDEKGTVLSVNHDYWGTIVTYFGYFLLFTTLIISFFTQKTRFIRVSQQIKETHERRKKLLVSMVIILLTFSGLYDGYAKDAYEISKKHAASFGKLLVQNKDGRIVPVNTNSNEILVKIFKKNSFEGLTADQVFLGMISNPQHWQGQPMIKVGDEDLQKILGIKGSYAKL